jgi:hypothetical protein
MVVVGRKDAMWQQLGVVSGFGHGRAALPGEHIII